MSKDEVIRSIRQSLKRRGALAGGVAEALAARLATPCVHHPQPALAGDPVACFLAKAALVSATVDRIPCNRGLPAAVLGFLKDNDLPLTITIGADPLLDLAWSNELSVKRGLPDPADQVSVTAAFAGIAETGTVVMLSSPDSPTTLNFLPQIHIAVLRRSRIMRYTEDVWRALRAERRTLPRAVNFITGPSRTGDVEQVLQLGAHGPRRLHVILLER
ncbi:MAG: lactate utilization protein C [Gammaproteobacteria bacterium]|nr:lactate utilization protein C [Gammaproteobacteria bacterium]